MTASGLGISNLQILSVLLIAVLVAVVPSGATADAHKPGELGSEAGDVPITARDVETSTVHYVTLSDEKPEFLVFLEITNAPLDLFVQLGQPKLDRLRSHNPRLILVEDGVDTSRIDSLTEDAPGVWVITDDGSTPREEFYEPVTGTSSWILSERTVVLPAPGTYRLVAWAPEGQRDKIWIAFGTKERFGLVDLVKLPYWIVKVRQFHEAGVGPAWFVVTLVVTGVSVKLLALLFLRKYLRRFRGTLTRSL